MAQTIFTLATVQMVKPETQENLQTVSDCVC